MNARPYPRAIVETCGLCMGCALARLGQVVLCPALDADLEAHGGGARPTTRAGRAGALGEATTRPPSGTDSRAVAQPEGQRSPKPPVAGSNPARSATDVRSGRQLVIENEWPLEALLAGLVAPDLPELLELRRIYEPRALGVRVSRAR